MKIRMSTLKRLIREAITSLASSQGFRAAGLAAGGPYKRDIPKFRDQDALEAAVIDDGDYELLFDTLRQMLVDDEKSHYLDPRLVDYIKRFLSAYDTMTSPGTASGSHEITTGALENMIRAGLAGLYDAGAPRSQALEMFNLVEKLGPDSLEAIALSPRSPALRSV
jgi:hypothetical protein